MRGTGFSGGVLDAMTTAEPQAGSRAEPRSGNQLLAALPPDAFDRLLPHLEPVTLAFRQRLIEPHRVITHVHFPEAGLSSDLAMSGEDRPVECGLIGRDGVVGLPVVFGTSQSAHMSFMQVAGHGRRIASAALQEAMDRSPSLRRVLLNYAHVFMMQAAQSTACQARHGVDQRLARWLLMSHDRMSDDRVPLTHEYLSLMLGVRRASVTVALGACEASGAIRQSRGAIAVADRALLERRSCACYAIVRSETARIFG